MIGVLHHMPKPENVINSLSRLLAPDGIIVVNEPQAGNSLIGLLRKIRRKLIIITQQIKLNLPRKNLFNI